ncbi:MAG TPA: cobalamin biosynthesis protein [Candidatus Anaerobiospirillum stercoravium]|nr:cobalamin biosynthesis protein [Candidatus Anaerobiospirillum stercoravium]
MSFPLSFSDSPSSATSSSLALPDITVTLNAAGDSIFDQAYRHFNQQDTPATPHAPVTEPQEVPDPAPSPYSAPYDQPLERLAQHSQSQNPTAETGSDWAQNLNLDHVDVGLLVSEPSLALAIAVLIEMLIPLPRKIKLGGLSSIFAGLARKVNRPSFSAEQRAFAGILLPTLIVAVLLFLVLTLDLIAGFDLIVALVVLVLVLDLRFAQERSVQVERALREGFKDKAKGLLAPMVLRETSMLSELGIAKACAESVILRIFSGWFAVMVWFFIAGLEGAVVMQTITILTREYNYKLRGNAQFGKYLFRIQQIMLALPALALSVCLFFSKNPLRALACGKEGFNQYPAPISGFVLGAVGGALNLSLGGPRYYQGTMVRLPKIGGNNNPIRESILYAMRKIRMCGLIMLVLAILIDLNF